MSIDFSSCPAIPLPRFRPQTSTPSESHLHIQEDPFPKSSFLQPVSQLYIDYPKTFHDFGADPIKQHCELLLLASSLWRLKPPSHVWLKFLVPNDLDLVLNAVSPKGSCATNGPCQGTVFDAGIQHDTLEKNMDTMDQSLIWPNGTNIALKQHRKSISLAPYASCYFTQLQWLNIWAGRTAHSDAVDHFQASFVARKPRSDSEVFGHQIWVELDTITCPEGLFKNTINTAT